jgi:Gluconolactonase
MRFVFPALVLSIALYAADSPLIPGEKPAREPNVGAGEGPAWDGKGTLYFTGKNGISRRDASGRVTVFREAAAGANGLLFDHQGRLVVCEARNRRVVRIEPDGSTTVMADQYQGMPFNSPNDLTIDSKGRIYFTDPRYGNRDDMKMRDKDGKLVEGVYRIDAPGKVTRIMAHEVDRPNGILVSAGDRYLYVADNNNNTPGGARKLWRFRLKSDGSIDPASRKMIFDWKTGRGPDGLKADENGLLYVAAGRNKPSRYETVDEFKGGVYILSPEGKQIDFIAIPDDEVTNCAFGGSDRKTLYITAGGNLWSLRVKTPGWKPSSK